MIKSRKISLAKLRERYRHETRVISYNHPLLAFKIRCCPVQSIGKYLDGIVKEQVEKIE